MDSIPDHFKPDQHVTWFTVTGEERQGVIKSIDALEIVIQTDDSETHSAPENIAVMLHWHFPLHIVDHADRTALNDDSHFIIGLLPSHDDAAAIATTMNDAYYNLRSLYQQKQLVLKRLAAALQKHIYVAVCVLENMNGITLLTGATPQERDQKLYEWLSQDIRWNEVSRARWGVPHHPVPTDQQVAIETFVMYTPSYKVWRTSHKL